MPSSKKVTLDDAKLTKIVSHPLRLRIFDFFLDHDEASPVAVARETGESVQLVAYHVRELRDIGVLELVATKPRRGALEHFYSIAPETSAALRALAGTLSDIAQRIEAA